MIAKEVKYLYVHKFNPKGEGAVNKFPKEVKQGAIVRAFKGTVERHGGLEMYFIYIGERKAGVPEGFLVNELYMNNEEIEYDFTEITEDSIFDLPLEPEDFLQLGAWRKENDSLLKNWNENQSLYVDGKSPEQLERANVQEQMDDIFLGPEEDTEEGFKYQSEKELLDSMESLQSLDPKAYMNVLASIKSRDPNMFRALSLLIHHLYVRSPIESNLDNTFSNMGAAGFNTGYNIGITMTHLQKYVLDSSMYVKNFDKLFEACTGILNEIK